MYKYIVVIVCFMFYYMQSKAINEYVEVDLEIGNLKVDTISHEEKIFSKVSLKRSYSSTEIGAPELPVYYVRFIVPVESNNFKVTLTPLGMQHDYQLYYQAWPVQIPEPNGIINDKIPFTPPTATSYSAASEYTAKIIHDSFINGCEHIVTVEIRPVQYDDNNRIITSCNRFGIMLDYDICSISDLLSNPIFISKGCVDFKLKEIVVNPDKYDLYVRHKKSSNNSKRYIIITPESLSESLSDLILWKKEKGYQVTIKTVENIFSDPEYAIGITKHFQNSEEELVDSAASVRAYLKDQFESSGSFYCLMVGDSRTSIPIRRMQSRAGLRITKKLDNPYSYNPCGNLYVPTDNYFSDFTSPVNLTKDDGEIIYTIPTSGLLNYDPDISIGRLLCSSGKEVCNYISKLITYESNPGNGDCSYLKNIVYFEQDKQPSGSLLGESTIVRESFNPFPSSTTIIADSCYYIENYHNIVPHKGKDIINAISMCGYSSWHGHGSPVQVGTCNIQYFISANSLYSEDQLNDVHYEWDNNNGLNNLNNLKFPSIVYSGACTIAPFDVYVDPREEEIKGRKYYYDGHTYNVPYNMASSFTTGGLYGGPAILANTREGMVQRSSYLEAEFGRCLYKLKCVGTSEALSKSTCENTHLSFTHHLIGDPEFNMWLELPKRFSDFNLFNNGFNVFSNDLEGARITIFQGLGEPITFNCNNNSVLLNEISNMDDFCISVWKDDFLPEIKFFAQRGIIQNCSKRYLVNEAFFGSNKGGNNDCFTVGKGASISLNAKKSVNIESGFIVENGGSVFLQCDGDINIGGCVIKPGGRLLLKGRNIKISDNFIAEKGAIMEILNQ